MSFSTSAKFSMVKFLIPDSSNDVDVAQIV